MNDHSTLLTDIHVEATYRLTEALIESEQRMRRRVECLSEVVFETDGDGKLVFMNKAWTNTLGYAVSASVKTLLSDYVVSEDRPLLEMIIQAGAASGPARPVIHMRHSDGGIVCMEIAISTLNGPGIVGSMHDVTNQRQNQQELEKLSLVASFTDNLVVITDGSGRFEWVNEAFVKRTGYNLKEVIGLKPGHVLQGPETDQEMVAFIRQQLRQGLSFQAQLLNYTKAGAPYWVEFHVTPIKGKDGKIERYIAVQSEITELKRTQSELKIAKEKAEAASEAKSDFLATMSHEIRTPMNGVIGMTELLKRSKLDARQSEMVDAIQHSGGALMNIIDDILNFAKIEAGHIKLVEQPLVLEELVEGVADLLHHEATSKGLELTTILAPELPEVIRGDAGRLRQVLLNLAGNAVKFTDNGHVTIRVSNLGDQIEFRVEDSGIGLPKAAHERLFKPFSQVDSSQSRRFGGTGLGLAICKKLVDAMSGSIGVESEAGDGSQFWFRVPLRAVPDQKAEWHSMLRRVWIAHTSPRMRESIRATLAAPGVEFHELKRTQVRRHLAAGREEDELLVVEAAWMPAALAKKDAAQPKEAGVDLRRLVLIGSGTHAHSAALTHAPTVTLPLHRQALRQAVWPVTVPAKGTTGLPHRLSLGLNVLVAEDNRINARLACLLLDNLGCKVVVAGNGKEAVSAFQQQPFGVVLMDCQMPIMDGHAATRKIREWEARQFKPHARRRCTIIAMTASALPEERDRCLASGMDDYLSKPFDTESLELLLTKIARQSGAEDEISGKTTSPPTMADPMAMLTAQIGEVEARKLANIWLEEAPGRHQRLMAALKRRQPEIARKEAHSLRGASSLFGMRSLMDACTSVEMAIRNDKCVPAGLVEEFSDHLQHSVSLLQRSMIAG